VDVRPDEYHHSPHVTCDAKDGRVMDVLTGKIVSTWCDKQRDIRLMDYSHDSQSDVTLPGFTIIMFRSTSI